ncbi:hypothetical protein AAFF27_16955 [Xylophilus sp. GW821-FHT01B05]
MSFKNLLQLIDAPLAIVVGSVCTVLLAIQLGASGLVMAQDVAPRRSTIDAQARTDCAALLRCTVSTRIGALEACVREKVASLDGGAVSTH